MWSYFLEWQRILEPTIWLVVVGFSGQAMARGHPQFSLHNIDVDGAPSSEGVSSPTPRGQIQRRWRGSARLLVPLDRGFPMDISTRSICTAAPDTDCITDDVTRGRNEEKYRTLNQ